MTSSPSSPLLSLINVFVFLPQPDHSEKSSGLRSKLLQSNVKTCQVDSPIRGSTNTDEQSHNVNDELFLVQYCSAACMQRMFNFTDVQNIGVTPVTEQNWTLWCMDAEWLVRLISEMTYYVWVGRYPTTNLHLELDPPTPAAALGDKTFPPTPIISHSANTTPADSHLL